MLPSSIAKKAVVAVTGLLLFGFVVVHMIGNLQVFLGRETLNNYAEFLHSMPELLWAARIGLLTAIVLHVVFTVWVWRENRASRPQRYAVERTIRASRASRTMILSGLLVLSFIIYHLLHFTVQVTNPDYRQFYEHQGRPVTLVSYEPPPQPSSSRPEAVNGAEDAPETIASEASPRIETIPAESVPVEARRDVYRMVVLGFRSPLIALTYIIAQLLLGLHLSHGASAMFQTLGLTTPKYRKAQFLFGPAAAALIVLGNVSIPLVILLDHWAGLGLFDV
ncbi:succinate dehydrogenase cytochrome b subunit [Tautonia sociabilis]|uniref:Succinate dehydrogenase cytochrome b subunit n=1 Tax=Tautonia sociabilis TaxID=2080755 RepID=A0A432MRM5_9BACT|nr:succinate dehydrogenase cytochrome b subunit [Tautonia sociabilis]RUL89657.1 succinate dehydrogenase cytochrome b subunit [Tautonia sociabilis]